MQRTIDTRAWSDRYRKAALDVAQRRLLITNFHGTEQEPDLSEPANCSGFGRIRHFHLEHGTKWVFNPLPIEPARRALALANDGSIRAQVFQNSVCNWRCWYCFVPFSLLNANPRHSSWLSPKDLVDLYLADPNPPPMIDLSGGQPDLTPEWIPWMMEELSSRGLSESVYLWSDDNLSSTFFWDFLTPSDRNLVKTYENYGRVACFKGIDRNAFAFNTGADPKLFDCQFDLFRRLLELRIDLYAYVTLTTPFNDTIEASVSTFVQRLQQIHPLLPLRTVPLEIVAFSPVKGRLGEEQNEALENQYVALDCWRRELTRRFTPKLLSTNICDLEILVN